MCDWNAIRSKAVTTKSENYYLTRSQVEEVEEQWKRHLLEVDHGVCKTCEEFKQIVEKMIKIMENGERDLQQIRDFVERRKNLPTSPSSERSTQ